MRKPAKPAYRVIYVIKGKLFKGVWWSLETPDDYRSAAIHIEGLLEGKKQPNISILDIETRGEVL